ncbi:MAG: aminodeoxychorismate lyase [Burkholderiales bacterium]
MELINGVPGEYFSVRDRGLQYGDGVFRTLLVQQGRPRAWHRHIRKLQSDCNALDIACPDGALLTEEAGEVTQSQRDCVLKIIITRGTGTRGYAIATHRPPTRILLTGPLPEYPPQNFSDGIRLHLCRIRLGHQPRLAGVKHLNRLENVLARREWDDADLAEGLLLDCDDNVIEGTMSNVFLYAEDVLVTPDLSRCGVCGVQRERILESASRLGLKTSVQRVSLEMLQQAREVMLCNSLIGIWQVRAFNDKTWPLGRWTAALRKLLDEPCD